MRYEGVAEGEATPGAEENGAANAVGIRGRPRTAAIASLVEPQGIVHTNVRNWILGATRETTAGYSPGTGSSRSPPVPSL